jgi:hypothetical protein
VFLSARGHRSNHVAAMTYPLYICGTRWGAQPLKPRMRNVFRGCALGSVNATAPIPDAQETAVQGLITVKVDRSVLHGQWLRGACAPEQRPSGEAAGEFVVVGNDVSNSQGGLVMKESNNTEEAQLRANWHHICLVFLHFVVFILSAISQPVWTPEAESRALPEAIV